MVIHSGMSLDHIRPDTGGTEVINGVRRGRFQDPPNRGSQVQNARVYTFTNDVSDDEINQEDVELSELRPRGASKMSGQSNSSEKADRVEHIEREVGEGETLQVIALKYGCPVAELKRINNLIRDQDFYARRTIKVPMKRHGLLKELVMEEKRLGNNVKLDVLRGAECDSVTHHAEEDDDSETTEFSIRTISIGSTLTKEGERAAAFLKKMDADIKGIVQSTKNTKDTLEEVAATLTCKRIHPLSKPSSAWSLGADCGMSMKSVIGLVVLVGLVLPVMYLVYFIFQPTAS